MIDKILTSAQAALADIPDGATIMISGFGNAGMPSALIDALIAQGARNFAPIMAAAAKCTVVQVREIVELGAIDPEVVVTPGIFVRRVVKIATTLKKAA